MLNLNARKYVNFIYHKNFKDYAIAGNNVTLTYDDVTNVDSLGIVTEACKKIDISRQTFYRWYQEDEVFKKEVDLNEIFKLHWKNDLKKSY